MIKALCSCGNELNRDGYEKIDIVDDGLLCIEGKHTVMNVAMLINIEIFLK